MRFCNRNFPWQQQQNPNFSWKKTQRLLSYCKSRETTTDTVLQSNQSDSVSHCFIRKWTQDMWDGLQSMEQTKRFYRCCRSQTHYTVPDFFHRRYERDRRMCKTIKEQLYWTYIATTYTTVNQRKPVPKSDFKQGRNKSNFYSNNDDHSNSLWRISMAYHLRLNKEINTSSHAGPLLKVDKFLVDCYDSGKENFSYTPGSLSDEIQISFMSSDR